MISINGFVKGLMIESYIEDGSQLIGNGVFGQSITDPCLGWEKTEKLVYELKRYDIIINNNKGFYKQYSQIKSFLL